MNKHKKESLCQFKMLIGAEKTPSELELNIEKLEKMLEETKDEGKSNTLEKATEIVKGGIKGIKGLFYDPQEERRKRTEEIRAKWNIPPKSLNR